MKPHCVSCWTVYILQKWYTAVQCQVTEQGFRDFVVLFLWLNRHSAWDISNLPQIMLKVLEPFHVIYNCQLIGLFIFDLSSSANVRLLQWCWWTFVSFGMQHCVGCTVSIFTVSAGLYTLIMETARFSKTFVNYKQCVVIFQKTWIFICVIVWN